ncbi:MAG TPA: trehalase family glycosidase, partial [Candidatus Saccharimonadia bacterium]|nr:trehalase family glycosidase [Candidatus Saccharimonadia bacterium]
DITFNSLLLRNNEHLVSIAKTIKIKLPKELQENIKKTKDAFGELWDSDTNQFYSRNFYTNNLIIEPSIGSLMPLYSGYSDKGKLDKIVKCLEDQNLYGCNYPIPSVPLNSKWFSETEYWQGPTWVNANWLIIDGLLRNNYIDIAEVLKETTLDMVDNSGIYDYYNPINGHGVGIKDFSWTAALSLDLAKNYKKT